MKILLLVLVEVIILLGIILINFMFEPVLILIFLVWLFLIKTFRLKFYYSIVYGLINLLLCPFLLSLKLNFQAENLANFAYFFLLIGVIQTLFFDRINFKERSRD